MKARIECCDHHFCFPCIQLWGTQNENACPLCKKKFSKIYYLDVMGTEQSQLVPDKKNANYESMWCEQCSTQIFENDAFETCLACADGFVHRGSCLMRYRDVNGYDFVCKECLEHDSSYSSNSSEQDEEPEDDESNGEESEFC